MISNRKIEFPDEYWKNISIGAKNLVENLLKFDPAQRITAKEILQHPWIHGEENGVSTNTTVFDLMKSYKAEKRLKKIINVVLAAIYLCNGTFKENYEPVLDTEKLNENNSSELDVSKEKKTVKSKSNNNKVKDSEDRTTGRLTTKSHLKTGSSSSGSNSNPKLNVISSSDKAGTKKSSSNIIKSKITHESENIISSTTNSKVVSKQTNNTGSKTQTKKSSLSPEIANKNSNTTSKNTSKRGSLSNSVNISMPISNYNNNTSPLSPKKSTKISSNNKSVAKQ